MSVYGSFDTSPTSDSVRLVLEDVQRKNSESSVGKKSEGQRISTTQEKRGQLLFESETHSKGSELVFKDVCAKIDKCDILKKVSGMARSGQLLAIMGPSGAGKSTLLNALTGRLTVTSGLITLNGQPITRRLRRLMSYVVQQDVFYPNLTLRETLAFTAMLRLPDQMSHEARLVRIQQVVEVLELTKCLDTKMGGTFASGLSGGERKRTSIACELLTNPKIIILDEPTSGLDSAIANSLMVTLMNYSRISEKTVVTTIHQPSSQIFHMFTDVLLLTEGEMVYFGPASEILDHFRSIGLHCDPLYNPADFLLEQMKLDSETFKRILLGAQELRTRDEWPLELRDETLRNGTCVTEKNMYGNFRTDEGSRHYQFKDPEATHLLHDNLDSEVNVKLVGQRYEDGGNTPKWQTGFLTQYTTLTRRAFVRSKDRYLSLITFCQIIVVAIVIAIEWFQLPRTEEVARDRLGLLYYVIIHQSFHNMQSTLFLIFDESGVFMKERASGIYRVSAYYLAVMTAEIPISFTLTTIYVIIVYWSTGLMPRFTYFLAFWMVVLLSVLTSQSIGFLLSVLLRDRVSVATISATVITTSVLTGGFFNFHVAQWFQWTKYISYFTYLVSIACEFEFTRGLPLSCNPPNMTSFPEFCINGTTLPGSAFVERSNIQVFPLYTNILIIISLIIFLRTLTYFLLRYFRRPTV